MIVSEPVWSLINISLVPGTEAHSSQTWLVSASQSVTLLFGLVFCLPVWIICGRLSVFDTSVFIHLWVILRRETTAPTQWLRFIKWNHGFITLMDTMHMNTLAFSLSCGLSPIINRVLWICHLSGTVMYGTHWAVSLELLGVKCCVQGQPVLREDPVLLIPPPPLPSCSLHHLYWITN